MISIGQYVKRLYKFISASLMMIFFISSQTFAANTDNPYVNKTIEIIGKLKTWALALVGVITVVKIVQYAIQYQSGGDDDKVVAIKSIRRTIIMGGGIFFLVWFASYVVEQYSGITP